MTISSESCPICGRRCEEDVKRVWPNAVAQEYTEYWVIHFYQHQRFTSAPYISDAPNAKTAWHSAAQRPEVKAMREAGKAAEMSVEEVFCMKRDPETNFACALTPGHRGRHDSKALPPAPVEEGPQPAFACPCDKEQCEYPHCLEVNGMYESKNCIALSQGKPPAAKRGEPKGIEDLLFVRGAQPSEGNKAIRLNREEYVIEINRRIREAEKIGADRGFNACREMAALQIVGFVDTSMVLSAVTAIRNLKQPEGL